MLRNQLKELCLTLDTAIEKAVTKNAKGGAPGLPQGTSAFNEKAPKESLKIKQKELENAYSQLNLYKWENDKLKKRMSDSQNTKETVAQMTEKLKEIEGHNEEMLKEIKMLKRK